MAAFDEVMARVANDPAFADAVRTDPTNALRGYQLDPSELERLERALGASAYGGPALFTPTAAGSSTGIGTLALVAGGLAVLGAAVGVGLGAAGVFGGGGGGGDGTGAATLRPDAAPFFDCSADDATGAVLGDLHRGDTVWVIGRTDDGWLVIRNPQDLTTPAWMQAGNLELGGDTGGLPELDCAQAVDEALVPPPSTAPGDTTTSSTTTSTTVPGATTTIPATTSPATTSPATTSPATTTPATSPTTPPPTTAPDTTGPAVAVTPGSPFVYSEGGAACAGYLQQVTVSVSANDLSGATVQGVTWAAGSLSGNATALGGNQFRIGPVYSTHNGTITMTITAQAVDGRGNAGSGQTTVQFRQIADECIG